MYYFSKINDAIAEYEKINKKGQSWKQTLDYFWCF
jgi:hypothetical protein